jgi:hypothetical protein
VVSFAELCDELQVVRKGLFAQATAGACFESLFFWQVAVEFPGVSGPAHTVGFLPNTYMDVTVEWQAAMEWLGQLMAFVRNRPYDAQSPDSAQSAKETLARYRGMICGVKYAEAVWATGAYPRFCNSLAGQLPPDRKPLRRQVTPPSPPPLRGLPAS